MISRNDLVRAALLELELALRRAGLWGSNAPSVTALGSTLPFCVDTLRLEQWLQFVFVPKIQLVIDQEGSLPTACAIAPVAEQAFVNYSHSQLEVVQILRAIDQALTETH